MKQKTFRALSQALIVTMLGAALLAPITASSLASRTRASQHRQQTKNEWRNIAIGSGGLAVLGLLKHDNTLTFIGAAGALYSANRYEHDRKSQSKTDRARARYFSKTYFYRDGHRYNRKTVVIHGKKSYQFVRASK